MPAAPAPCPACGTPLPTREGARPQGVCPECGYHLPPPTPAGEGWYYARGREKVGPVALRELQRLVRAGELRPTDMVLKAGTTKWEPLRTVAGLSFESPAALAAEEPDQALPDQAGGNAPAGLGRAVLREGWAVAVAPFLYLARLGWFVRVRFRLASLSRAARAAELALGRRIYQTGGGDKPLCDRLATLDEEICRREGQRQSATAAKAERDRLLLQLAQKATTPAPAKAIEGAHSHARGAARALAEHAGILRAAWRGLVPQGAANWARVVAGFGVVFLLGVLVAGYGFTGTKRGPEGLVIDGLGNEREMVEAVGWVICGFRIALPNGAEVAIPHGAGTCFAVTGDGHLLTNKHVVNETWEELHAPDKIQRRELFRRQVGGRVTPTIWVFFGKDKYEGRIVHLSGDYDLAVLKVERSQGPFFRLSKSDCPARGTKLAACGFPGATRIALSEREALDAAHRQDRLKQTVREGRPIRIEEHFRGSDFEFDFTSGVVSRPLTEENQCKWVQHDATIHKGNSGGPLLAEDGTVVGINTLKHQMAAGVNWSLSLPQLRQEIDRHAPGTVWK